MKITRRQVLALVVKWKPRLLLDAWDIRVKLTTKLPQGWQADCACYPEYMDASLRINPALVTPEELEGVLVHELMHCHTWPLWEHAEDGARGDPHAEKSATIAHERLTSTLQRIVMR